MSDKFPDLFSLNLLYQANAEAFFAHNDRKKLAELFQKDALHILGSDMHNLTSRPPNLAEAYKIIEKRFGSEYINYINRASQKVLKNGVVPSPKLSPLKFIKKLML